MISTLQYEPYCWYVGALSGIVEKEERDRKVLGLSAANKCIILSEMVGGMAAEMGNADNEEAAIVKLLEKGGESHMKGWNLV